ncbi:MAG: ROK family protein [Chloroflexi bacterium]|nr:ROK family protein [Chloroflexota bacterium]
MSLPYAVGIDIGASNTKVGLVRLEQPARIVTQQTLHTRLGGTDPEPFFADLYAAVTACAGDTPVTRIGISLCSLIDAGHTGAFLSVNAPALNHFNIKAAFEARFDCPVQVMNDVNAYALAEYYYGAGQGTQRLLCLALGTGLAIAVINQGRLIETWAGVPADAARIVLEPAAEVVCNGGVRGSAEALCGTASIERVARLRYVREDIRARDVISASRAGDDPSAAAIMAEVGGHVGHLLAILSPVFFPQRILITGGPAQAGEPLFDAIRARYTALIGDYMANLALHETGLAHPVDIRQGTLGPDAAILGAVIRT